MDSQSGGCFVPEAIQETAQPLVANGDRWRKDQRRFVHAPQCFQTDNGLAGTWRRDQMKVIVIEMGIEFRENARLVWPPGVAKLDILRKALGELAEHVARRAAPFARLLGSEPGLLGQRQIQRDRSMPVQGRCRRVHRATRCQLRDIN